jgi:hypothetical protein
MEPVASAPQQPLARSHPIHVFGTATRQPPFLSSTPSRLPPDSDPVIVLSRSPTLDTILQYLSPGDVARLQCTCTVISDALIAWKRAAYNINCFLERFFKDPVAFRVLQAQTKLIISGSSALQFMDRYVLSPKVLAHDSLLTLASWTRTFSIFYNDSDLDLYVSSSRTREVVMFLRTQNYDFFPGDQAGVSTDLESLLTELETEKTETTEPFEREDLRMCHIEWTNGSPYHGPCIHGVLYFRHRENATLVVQVIAIHNYLPPIFSVMWYHSSTCKCLTLVVQWRVSYISP